MFCTLVLIVGLDRKIICITYLMTNNIISYWFPCSWENLIKQNSVLILSALIHYNTVLIWFTYASAQNQKVPKTMYMDAYCYSNNEEQHTHEVLSAFMLNQVYKLCCPKMAIVTRWTFFATLFAASPLLLPAKIAASWSTQSTTSSHSLGNVEIYLNFPTIWTLCLTTIAI